MNRKFGRQWACGYVVDPLCEGLINHRRYRTDHILKDNGVDADGLTMEQMVK